MWLYYLYSTVHATSSESWNLLLFPSILYAPKILPNYWSLTILLNQSEWNIFRVYKKILPQQKNKNENKQIPPKNPPKLAK